MTIQNITLVLSTLDFKKAIQALRQLWLHYMSKPNIWHPVITPFFRTSIIEDDKEQVDNDLFFNLNIQKK